MIHVYLLILNVCLDACKRRMKHVHAKNTSKCLPQVIPPPLSRFAIKSSSKSKPNESPQKSLLSKQCTSHQEQKHTNPKNLIHSITIPIHPSLHENIVLPISAATKFHLQYHPFHTN